MASIVVAKPAGSIGRREQRYAREELLIATSNQVRTQEANGDGDAIIEFPGPGPGNVFKIDRATVATLDGSSAKLNMYLGVQSRVGLVDFTYLGANDISEYPQGLLVETGLNVIFEFYDATPGTTCIARIQWRLLEYLSVTV